MGEHGQGDVAVSGMPFADLVVVQAALVFGGLEAFLDCPPGAGDGHDLFPLDRGGVKTQVVGDIGGVVEGSAGQQGPGVSGGEIAEIREGGPSPVVFTFTTFTEPGRNPVPRLIRRSGDECVDAAAAVEISHGRPDRHLENVGQASGLAECPEPAAVIHPMGHPGIQGPGDHHLRKPGFRRKI